MVVGRKDEMLREEQQDQYPFVKVDGFYVSAEEYNELREIAEDLENTYRRVLKLGLIHNRDHYDSQEYCKKEELPDDDSGICCGQSEVGKYSEEDGDPIVWDAEKNIVWDHDVSIPEGFVNNDFQESEQTIHGHKVKWTGKDRGYIDGKYYERTEFLRRINCYKNGWETPDDAIRATKEVEE